MLVLLYVNTGTCTYSFLTLIVYPIRIVWAITLPYVLVEARGSFHLPGKNIRTEGIP